MKRLVFVCHGNICRSPMAEEVMRHLVEEAGCSAEYEIASAAVSTEEIGSDMYPPAQRKLREKGIPFGRHLHHPRTNLLRSTPDRQVRASVKSSILTLLSCPNSLRAGVFCTHNTHFLLFSHIKHTFSPQIIIFPIFFLAQSNFFYYLCTLNPKILDK